jgi:hypothetical protein
MHLDFWGILRLSWQFPGSFENFSEILMKIDFLWDVTFSLWVNSCRASSVS